MVFKISKLFYKYFFYFVAPYRIDNEGYKPVVLRPAVVVAVTELWRAVIQTASAFFPFPRCEIRLHEELTEIVELHSLL